MKRLIAITGLILLAGGAGACAKMLGLEQEKQDHAFEHRAHVVQGINCLECHAGIQEHPCNQRSPSQYDADSDGTAPR